MTPTSDIPWRAAYDLALQFMGKPGLETDRLSGAIRRRLPDFVAECHASLSTRPIVAVRHPEPEPIRTPEDNIVRFARADLESRYGSPLPTDCPPAVTASIYRHTPEDAAAIASHAEAAERRRLAEVLATEAPYITPQGDSPA